MHLSKILISSLLILGTVNGCTCAYIEPGHVGILVNQLGDNRGGMQVVGVGRRWVGPFEKLYDYPLWEQTYSWTASVHEGKTVDESMTFQVKGPQTVRADIGIVFSIPESTILTVFKKYRKDPDSLRDTIIRQAVRDALNTVTATMTVEQACGTMKMEIMHHAERLVRAQLEKDGIHVSKLSLLNDFRPPASYTEAANAAAVSTQKAQQAENELRTTRAEAAKAIAAAEGDAQVRLTRAKAESQANREIGASISTTLVEYLKWGKWNGVLPSVVGGAQANMVMLAPKEGQDR